GPARIRSMPRLPASGWRSCSSTTECRSRRKRRGPWKAGSWGFGASAPEKDRGPSPEDPPPVAGGADGARFLELLARALGHVGFEALLAHALEEGRVRFGLDDPIELAPVG